MLWIIFKIKAVFSIQNSSPNCELVFHYLEENTFNMFWYLPLLLKFLTSIVYYSQDVGIVNNLWTINSIHRSGCYIAIKMCVQMGEKRWHWVRIMVFNGSINNISAISWLSVLLMLKSVAYYRFLASIDLYKTNEIFCF
jgi:hypothetical protein